MLAKGGMAHKAGGSSVSEFILERKREGNGRAREKVSRAYVRPLTGICSNRWRGRGSQRPVPMQIILNVPKRRGSSLLRCAKRFLSEYTGSDPGSGTHRLACVALGKRRTSPGSQLPHLENGENE